MSGCLEDTLRSRVEARAAEIGRSLGRVMRDADVSESYFKARPKGGRRIDKLEKIARALDWSLAELLGIAPPVQAVAELNVDVLERALIVADMVIGDNPLPEGERRNTMASIAARAYDLLMEISNSGFATERDASLEVIAAAFRAGGR